MAKDRKNLQKNHKRNPQKRRRITFKRTLKIRKLPSKAYFFGEFILEKVFIDQPCKTQNLFLKSIGSSKLNNPNIV
jgi:hypothetical protein